MNSATTSIQNLARRLIALEASCDSVTPARDCGAERVCEKLRLSLVKFAGVAGYRTLISRALALAKVEAPSLEAVQIRADCSLEGFDRIESIQDGQAADIVLLHLLGLLVTFIGERLTLGLISAAWPDDLLDKTPSQTEEQP